MANALIGYSGFVGGTLLRQATFDEQFRSTNIGDIDGHSFDVVVCAGAPAQKWIANQDPGTDRRHIDSLIGHLRTVDCNNFVLISTVDVFKDPVGVDEATPVDESGLHAYGLHRRMLERLVEEQFPRHLIVRLPGLVGPGLRKNVIFDLLNDNNLDTVDSRGIFQFYPMVNLWYDIGIALDAGLKLVHLAAEPISVADIARECFGRRFEQAPAKSPARYDMRTRHARKFGGSGHYQYGLRETVQAIRAYAQSEPLTVKPRPEAGP
ncbi:hypothetical protein [Sulfuritalea sp.]|uniref:hypothetical protein n=1 Tax=Sulfuritalea sp. TaxID=2480090 RepID=UPI001AD498C4|nr:hypothetical protein [Sulfuritalea sp.]MBN8473470.1 NAD(P)-dependent oxidoreductase [Sulfuritalea sp.]